MAQESEDSGSNGTSDIRQELIRTVVASDLVERIAEGGEGPFHVIIEFNTRYFGGVKAARDRIFTIYDEPRFVEQSARATLIFSVADRIGRVMSLLTETYAFAVLSGETIRRLANGWRHQPPERRPIYKLWLDHEIRTRICESARTVKCDAARVTFGSAGRDIVWAVADSGIDAEHPHFQRHGTLRLPGGLRHANFTDLYVDHYAAGSSADLTMVPEVGACEDTIGHGTHVGGIIAGETISPDDDSLSSVTGGEKFEICLDREAPTERWLNPAVDPVPTLMSGMAPRCRLMSLKVIGDANAPGGSRVSAIIVALNYIQQINGFGREIKVHGVNISLGYEFKAQYYAAGHSPLCREVDRLVKSGVAVVVAAGNGGYGVMGSYDGSPTRISIGGTIDDPGNAEMAITVGSTHRTAPHLYGVSYFSAKGPTADGRMKPDLVAPGERILSCRAGDQGGAGLAHFKEDSGTSMAAPHVSGVIAAFLSVRREFIGRPEDVKALLKRTATDLGRQAEYQGAGLVDLMRAIQAV